MKNQSKELTVERKKVISIAILSIVSIGIVLSGILFSIFSLIYNISFTVLNAQIHGAVFGAVSIFLGVRYFMAVQKLKIEVYKKTSKFSWSNFKKTTGC